MKEEVLACKTPDDLLALAKEEGYELSDEQLEAVSGGLRWSCDDHTNTCTGYCHADDCLRQHGVEASINKPRGADVSAACGQLANRYA